MTVVEGVLAPGVAELRAAEAELRRLSPSLVLGDVRHFAVALVSDRGEVIAASRVGFAGSVQSTAVEVLAQLGPLERHDIVVTNDPAGGGTHVNDFTLMTPLDRGPGYLVIRFHTADFGGDRPGGLNPTAGEVWAEGARIRPLLLTRAGREQADVLSLLCLNTRTPDLLRGDLRAASAGLTVAAARVGDVAELLSADGQETALAGGERAIADALLGIDHAHFDTVGVHHCCTGVEAEIVARLRITGGGAHIDLAETSDAVPGFVNSGRGMTLSAVALPLLLSLAPGASPGGALRRITLEAPAESLVTAGPSHATGWSTYSTATRLAGLSASALAAAGISVAHYQHWYSDPQPVFAMPACNDSRCPYRSREYAGHATRYWPGDWA